MGQSTHLIHPLGVAHLRDWGVLPQNRRPRGALHRLARRPARHRAAAVRRLRWDGCDESRGPRRALLDGALAEAAAADGVEFRDGTRVV